MIRVPLPDGHNDTTARFHRTLLDAFPCDARAANPIEHHPCAPSGRFFYVLFGVLLVLCIAVLTGAAL